ncbi:MAG: VOC family protein [Thermoanaerobaculia bacterium]
MPSPVALHHTCFLVRDLERAARALTDALGIGPWNVWTIRPTASTVHGEPRPYTFRVALAAIGGSHYELVSPDTGTSVYDEHLASHGDGFHHTCLFYSTIAEVRAVKVELLRQGREMIQDASAGDDFEFAYFQFPEIGSAVEVLFLDPEKLPPPEQVI